MGEAVRAFLLAFAGQTIAMVGIFFISGQILPKLLAPVYDMTNQIGRTVLAGVLIFPFGNYIMGYAFDRFGPAVVSPAMFAALTLTTVVMTILILGTRPSLWIIPATALVMASCVWVSLLLQQKI